METPELELDDLDAPEIEGEATAPLEEDTLERPKRRRRSPTALRAERASLELRMSIDDRLRRKGVIPPRAP